MLGLVHEPVRVNLHKAQAALVAKSGDKRSRRKGTKKTPAGKAASKATSKGAGLDKTSAGSKRKAAHDVSELPTTSASAGTPDHVRFPVVCIALWSWDAGLGCSYMCALRLLWQVV